MRSATALLLLLAAAGGGCRPTAGLPDGDARCETGHVVGGIHEPEAAAVVVPVRKRAWETALGGEVAARPWVRARVSAMPTATRSARPVLPASDPDFVRQVARDTWLGVVGLTDREHHLPIDHVHLAPHHPATPPVGDYVNVTSIGLHLIATVAAADLGLITRDAARARSAAVLDTLERLETHRGFFFNYYDTTTLERTSHFLSFVDSAWLAAGLIVVRQALPELAERATSLIGRSDWGLFYDPGLGRMAHGYWVQTGAPSRYHYGMLYAESRLGSVIAIGKGDVPEEHWFRMVRTFPAACRWQRQTPIGRAAKTVRGHRVIGGHFAWGGVPYVPSWGGSMFEALMPTLVLDELRLAPASLGANARAHVTIQRRWASEVLGAPVWGLSPSLVPGSEGYREHGVPVLGALGYPPGAITPHATALALPIDPAAAVANLRRLATDYGAYGPFGFYDAVDAATGAVARSYLVLDQTMSFVALANVLCDGCVQRRFAADPLVARAVPVLAAERFFD